MALQTIKSKIAAYLIAWVAVLWLTHIAIFILGIKPYSLTFFLLPPLVSIVPFIFLGYYLYRQIVMPMELLAQAAKVFIESSRPPDIKIDRNDEIGIMVKEFNTMFQMLHERDVLVNGLLERFKSQNTELTRINEKLVETDRLKTNFLATVTHEWKTPLSTIRGYSEMMLEGVGGELSVTHREFAGEIISSTVHLLRMVNDVLDFTKAASGAMDIRFERFNLSDLMKECEMVIDPMLREKKQSLKEDSSADIVDVVADRGRVKQVLLNLLSNAVKFTPDGGNISFSSFRCERQWGVTVMDDGIGIKETDLKRIFVPFSQVDSSYARKYEGTGLGLAISRKIIELHGGHIWAESSEGKGSKFSFIIPDDLKNEREVK